MPSLIGYITENQERDVEQLVEDGKFEDKSEFVQKATAYYLDRKFNME